MRRVRVKTKPFDILRGGENHLKRRRFVVVRRWRTTAVALQLRPSPSDSPPYSLAGAVLKLYFVHRLTRRRNAASFLLSCPSPYDRAIHHTAPLRTVPIYSVSLRSLAHSADSLRTAPLPLRSHPFSSELRQTAPPSADSLPVDLSITQKSSDFRRSFSVLEGSYFFTSVPITFTSVRAA